MKSTLLLEQVHRAIRQRPFDEPIFGNIYYDPHAPFDLTCLKRHERHGVVFLVGQTDVPHRDLVLADKA